MKNLLLIILFSSIFQSPSYTQNVEVDHEKMQWFKDAKLGIFIHWGIYAVNGIDESWSFFNGYISHEDYLKQLEGFTAEKYDPVHWVKLIKESGARYSVITSKHHDGVALWDTKWGNLNIPSRTPANRDVLTPFVDALRKEKLKVGLYYSLPDWSYADYPDFKRNEKRYEKDSMRWQRFLSYYQNQLKELADRYDPDLWWFDGDWEHSAEEWEASKVRKMLLGKNSKTIINSRLREHGDYATPEQGLPILKPKADYWELCMTMNDSWGFQRNDLNYKTPYQIIRIFVDVLKNGGNLLLDIGPKADGSIPEEQVHILQELGKWTKKHEEAIYETNAGISPEHFYGPTTLSKNKDVLYLFLNGKPNGPIVLKGLKNKINRIRVVGKGTKLDHQILMKHYWSEIPGIVYIDVPEYVLDEHVTVIAVQLKGELDLYKE
ncbi:MAG: alpha-L-fucosidase [Bacteroidetes bacterium]|nr:alpha-L-fucosidase [Bacteroidota bacterium]